MEEIKVIDIIGKSYGSEDAILLRSCIEKDLDKELVLDFAGLFHISSNFLCCLLTDLINKNGRDYVASHIHVKNLKNISDYCRVLLGTAFVEDSYLHTMIN